MTSSTEAQRIAIVVHNAVRQDARVLKQASTLKAAGHDVKIFGLSSDEDESFLLSDGIPVTLTRRDTRGVKQLLLDSNIEASRENRVWGSFAEQGRQVFEAVRASMTPDAVHIHDHVSLTAASLYKERFNVPIVWDAHEIYEELAGLEDVRRTVNPRIIRENAQYVDAFITLNESIAQVYAERYPELPPATLIPNATRFSNTPVYDGRLHDAAGLNRDQKVLLFQGGFAEHRGIGALLDVAAFLDGSWSLVFMGWGKLEGSIREHAKAIDDRPAGKQRISVIPGAPHAELALWTAGASLGAIPYEDTGLNHRYCTPNKLWEFPAAGVPILATNLPEMAKRIEPTEMGFTVSPELDAPAIAEQINELGDVDLQRYKEGAEAFIRDDNWEGYEHALLEVHATLPAPTPKRSWGKLWRSFIRRR